MGSYLNVPDEPWIQFYCLRHRFELLPLSCFKWRSHHGTISPGRWIIRYFSNNVCSFSHPATPCLHHPKQRILFLPNFCVLSIPSSFSSSHIWYSAHVQLQQPSSNRWHYSTPQTPQTHCLLSHNAPLLQNFPRPIWPSPSSDPFVFVFLGAALCLFFFVFPKSHLFSLTLNL